MALTRPSMLSSRQLRPPRVGDEVTVDHVRKVPLQTANGLFVGLARFPRHCCIERMAVRGYLRFGLSFRDVEQLLAERGIEVDHVTIYRWVQRFTPEFAEAARARQH